MVIKKIPVFWTIACLVVAAAGSAQAFAEAAATPHQSPRRLVIQNFEIVEASGLAAHGGLLWTHNDSGTSKLYAIEPEGGTVVRTVTVPRRNRDWEDLALLPTATGQRGNAPGVFRLVVGEIGDNRGRYQEIAVHAVTVPVGPNLAKKPSVKTRSFQYQDGPRDAEALAYDASEERLLLLSKRDFPPRLYEIELAANPPADSPPARFLAEMHPLPAPTPAELLKGPPTLIYGTQPTAMDIAPAGSMLAVLTYRDVYLFEKEAPDEPWELVVQRKPRRLDIPQLAQAEGLCFSEDGKSLWVVSEGAGGPLIQVPLPD